VMLKSSLKMVSVLALVGFLAACESSEERAEGHYQSGLALLEQGDPERALVEFRNVFNLNGQHREARSTYARIVREQGKDREAYGQYLRLVEQYPDDLEGRIALSELAFASQNWEEFGRHASRAMAAAPDDPAVQAIAVAFDYRKGVIDEDTALRDDAFERAVTLIDTQPENLLLQQITLDGYLREKSFDKALAAIDSALALTPRNRQLYDTRLKIYIQTDNQAGLENLLREMISLFGSDAPIAPNKPTTLLQALNQYYLGRGEEDKVEVFLREISDPAAEDPGLYLSLVQFIGSQRGPDAAIAELEAVIPTLDNPDRYRALRAGLIFDKGQQTEAIDDLQQIIAATEPSEQQRENKVTLARMLLRTANEVGARQLIEQVLVEDPGQIDALKMSAAWQIESDDTEAAIATLRRALDSAPQDVAAMTLMSQAYQRAGNRNLASDFLALAVDTSGQAPVESMRYARFLAGEERLIEAEQVLVASLRQNRTNPTLLSELGRIYLALDDMARLRQVISQLSDMDTADTDRAAAALQTVLIEREGSSEEAIAYLEEISKDWDNAQMASVAVIRARLASGDSAGAVAGAAAMLAENPDDPNLRYLMAGTQTAAGRFDEAQAGYTALLEENPKIASAWLQLIRIAIVQDRAQDVAGLIEKGLAANPGNGDLLLVRAGILERAGDIDGAIAIYEELYARNSGNFVLANNLASLIATHNDDAESLDRAAAVAARLKDIQQPAFQDTYGWIAFRRGDMKGALAHLEPAARGLPGDAQVQYHLGRAYEAAERPDDAIAQYTRAIELAGENSVVPGIEDARSRLAALQAE